MKKYAVYYDEIIKTTYKVIIEAKSQKDAKEKFVNLINDGDLDFTDTIEVEIDSDYKVLKVFEVEK